MWQALRHTKAIEPLSTEELSDRALERTGSRLMAQPTSSTRGLHCTDPRVKSLRIYNRELEGVHLLRDQIACRIIEAFLRTSQRARRLTFVCSDHASPAKDSASECKHKGEPAAATGVSDDAFGTAVVTHIVLLVDLEVREATSTAHPSHADRCSLVADQPMRGSSFFFC